MPPSSAAPVPPRWLPRSAPVAAQGAPAGTLPPPPDTLRLPPALAQSVPVLPVGRRAFARVAPALGNVDVNEDASVQVLTSYQGRILETFAALGQEVRRGDPLFTLDSPDLMQAESTLIAAARVLQLANRNLARARSLVGAQGMSQHDLEQAVSAQQTTGGNLNAARDALRVFGKGAAEVTAWPPRAGGWPPAGLQPGGWPRHRARRAAGAVRASRQRARALRGDGPLLHVADGLRAGARAGALPPRPAPGRARRRLPGPRLRGRGLGGRRRGGCRDAPHPAARRDRRPRPPAANGDVRGVHRDDRPRRPGAGPAGGRRLPRRRRPLPRLGGLGGRTRLHPPRRDTGRAAGRLPRGAGRAAGGRAGGRAVFLANALATETR